MCSCLVAQSCLTLRPYGLQPAKLLVNGDSPGKNTGVRCHALLLGIFPIQESNPGLALWAGSLLSEPPGKLKNNGVSSLSPLQGIFLTQESNQGLLHCRWILYPLSYQVSPPQVFREYLTVTEITTIGEDEELILTGYFGTQMYHRYILKCKKYFTKHTV